LRSLKSANANTDIRLTLFFARRMLKALQRNPITLLFQLGDDLVTVAKIGVGLRKGVMTAWELPLTTDDGMR
jgi:hypothetical protein